MANELGELIASAESPLDGYLAYHNPNKSPRYRADRLPSLSGTSIQSVVDMLEKNPHHHGAVGKYQMTYGLLKDAIHDRRLNINPKAPFNPETQERIYYDYVISYSPNGRAIKGYITTLPDRDPEQDHRRRDNAISASAKIWSSLEDITGQGVFDKKHSIQSKVPSSQVGDALDAMRTNYWEAIHRGASPDDAWHVTTGIKPMPAQSIHNPDPYAESPSPYGPASSPSQSPAAPGHSLRQSPGSHLSIDPDDPFDQLYLASVTGDRQAFSQVAQNYLNSPEGQAFLQLGRDFNAQQLAEQQAREQEAQAQQEQMHHRIRMTR